MKNFFNTLFFLEQLTRKEPSNLKYKVTGIFFYIPRKLENIAANRSKDNDETVSKRSL